MFNFKLKKKEKTILNWSILPLVSYFFVCYFKIQNDNSNFYVSLSIFLILLVLLFYKIYALYKEE